MIDIDRPAASFSGAERGLRFDREHLRRLRALAYRMLGSRAEAEDIVREAWLCWAEVDECTVTNAGAYLSRVVTHRCLDRLRSASLPREQYIGVWLPEPWLDDTATIDDSPGPEHVVARQPIGQRHALGLLLLVLGLRRPHGLQGRQLLVDGCDVTVHRVVEQRPLLSAELLAAAKDGTTVGHDVLHPSVLDSKPHRESRNGAVTDASSLKHQAEKLTEVVPVSKTARATA